MARTISIGAQDFVKLREGNNFYIDKTGFILDWWKSDDEVTLITRPRRFGKTLNMRMLETFFSIKYTGRGEELFGDLEVWKDPEMRAEQGTWPVIFLSFAGVKQNNLSDAIEAIKRLITMMFFDYSFLSVSDKLNENEKKEFSSYGSDMSDVEAELSLNMLSRLLEKHYGKKVLILLDEYDTPLQEAFVGGYWDEMVSFIRSLFNNTFKTNPALGGAVMTGITRVSKESIFSDLNNLTIVTTTSDRYATAFGFTEDEVFAAMDEQGFEPALRERVKYFYDGFTFGNVPDIYNPWSITNYLKEKKFKTYWADSSSNGLVGNLIRTGDPKIKETFEGLLKGESIETVIDEQIVFSQLEGNQDAIWSLFLASGYLKIVEVKPYEKDDDLEYVYTLTITNNEVRSMFRKLISLWFSKSGDFPNFIKCMLTGNVDDMNRYMNRIALNTFSSFDTGVKPSDNAPERFYHGFVLGLMVEKASDYILKSNRESGYGRYDVVMEPKDIKYPAVIMEFKVMDKLDGEKDLSDTAMNALKQIEEKKYDTDLLSRGIPAERIYKYGFAFRGSECLIRMG